jgi:hypothetical protein
MLMLMLMLMMILYPVLWLRSNSYHCVAFKY